VWDYPRPPRVEPCTAELVIVLGGEVVARTSSSWRVLETSHPPTYYLPRSAFVAGSLRTAPGASWCEWKGQAAYVEVVSGELVAHRAGWTYPDPAAGYEVLAGSIAVMPGAMDRCTVDGEVVQAQEGGFYGGWITSHVVGPFKGGPGTQNW